MGFSKYACLLALLGGCSIPKPGPFYQTSALKTQPAGTLISVQPFTPATKGAAAYRVLYNSTDIHGDIIPVSGVIYIPLATAPANGRNVVAWAHPTTGMAPGCAPSLDTGQTGGISMAESIPGLSQFIAAGDIVAATDYQGMGVNDVHPYLIGDAEGRDILDSVRAAKQLPGADENGKFAVWGHSQGGQAALFAGQIAHDYAPELNLVGVAAAAPPTNMNEELTEPFKSNSGRLLAAYVYYSWSHFYNVPVTTIVYPQAAPAMNNAVTKCIATLGQAVNAVRAASALNPVFRSHDPKITPPWPDLLTENSPGHADAGAPLLIVQGSKDVTVEPHFTRSFASLVCARHEVLEYQELKGVSHLLIAYKATPVVTGWIQDRFNGIKAPDNCPM